MTYTRVYVGICKCGSTVAGQVDTGFTADKVERIALAMTRRGLTVELVTVDDARCTLSPCRCAEFEAEKNGKQLAMFKDGAKL